MAASVLRARVIRPTLSIDFLGGSVDLDRPKVLQIVSESGETPSLRPCLRFVNLLMPELCLIIMKIIHHINDNNEFDLYLALCNIYITNRMNLTIKSKFWLEIDGKPVFGRGKRCLLEAIEKCGSINQAAKEIKISYRTAWSYLNAMEERLGMKLIDRQAGGKNGGGTVLTENARTILKQYNDLESGLQKIVDERFRKIFHKNRL
jgi:molybdate transport system regulatory protein